MTAYGALALAPDLVFPVIGITGYAVRMTPTLTMRSVSVSSEPPSPPHTAVAGYYLAGTIARYTPPIIGQLWPRGDMDAL